MRFRASLVIASLCCFVIASGSVAAEPSASGPVGSIDSLASGVAGPLSAEDEIDARVELKQLLTKVGVGTVIAVAFAGVLVFLGGRRYRAKAERANSLWIKDTIGISPKCRVALLQLGNREVLIGHDHTGLRSMLIMPTTFTDTLDTLDALSGSREFLRVGDAGWDLTRRT